jgi:hypothetical protein
MDCYQVVLTPWQGHDVIRHAPQVKRHQAAVVFHSALGLSTMSRRKCQVKAYGANIREAQETNFFYS